MIAIPNMEKPKSCAECPIRIAELFGVYYEGKDEKCKRIKITGCDSSKYNGNTLAEDHKLMYKDCPLIDIVTCGECKWCEIRETANYIPFFYCLSDGISVKDTDYCSWGERRSE